MATYSSKKLFIFSLLLIVHPGFAADPASTDVLWARFYDLQTAKPIFAGADDGIVYSTFQEMAAKNKVAYDFFSTRPAELLGKELPRWRKRLEKGK